MPRPIKHCKINLKGDDDTPNRVHCVGLPTDDKNVLKSDSETLALYYQVSSRAVRWLTVLFAFFGIKTYIISLSEALMSPPKLPKCRRPSLPKKLTDHYTKNNGDNIILYCHH